jgi:nitroimidazol reductase NimA-like FMN-containing flavoprotein (pyridoxamine 5'-phosphate oxidase superfamily)
MPDDDADLSSSTGSASPDPGVDARRVLERLGEAECLELLATGGTGRLVFTSRYGPTALPVGYKIESGSIVLGTWDPVFDEDLRTGIASADYQVAVEADQIDPQARQGWIVLARGAAHHLDTEAERAPVIDAALEPWVEDVPPHYIRVTPSSVFGVRVRRTLCKRPISTRVVTSPHSAVPGWQSGGEKVGEQPVDALSLVVMDPMGGVGQALDAVEVGHIVMVGLG